VTATLTDRSCPLCEGLGGEPVWQGPDDRVILADEPVHPGLCRVVWTARVGEMSDLAPYAATRLMATVLIVKRVLRARLAPHKVNLASLGNLVPHLHWHVIPRWFDDSRFLEPVWAAQRREPPLRHIDKAGLVDALRQALAGRSKDAGDSAASAT
jgi:diadenosine tetraphosphate (Ap4A) HIT family hydrolase